MSSQPNYYLSPEEYLTIERSAECKSEYADGVMYAMAGGSQQHNLITGNLVTELNNHLRKAPCEVYPSDMKVRLPDTRKFFYPDVSVVCGEVQFADGSRDIILNPLLIIEVLSESTAGFDRGKKFQFYQQIESLQEYLLVAQDEYIVEHYTRQAGEHWLYAKVSGSDGAIELTSINCQLMMENVYNKVTL
jgi:Uma2 family endonuclease